MFTPLLLYFSEGTTLADADAGRAAFCFALTRVVLGDHTTNCSAALDLASYVVHSVPGLRDRVDAVECRSTLSTYTSALYTQETSDALSVALRAAGFFATSSPEARVVRTEWLRNVDAAFTADIVLLVILIAIMVTYVRRRTSTPVHAYSSVRTIP